jgi:hypothetical protein
MFSQDVLAHVMPARWTLLLGLSLAIAMVACHGRSDVVASGERYHGRGRIVALSRDLAVIHHERMAAVKGFDGEIGPMESMTMQFAHAQTSFSGLAVDDAVELEFTVHFDEGPTMRLVRITKLPAGTVLRLE